MSLPLEFELEQSGERTRNALAALLIFIMFASVILAFAPIREVVVAVGSVRHVGAAVAVHHEQGGAVQEVLASQGDIVRAGQPLLRLRDANLRSEIQELTVREIHLALRIERLRALLEGRDPEFATVSGGLAPAAARNERRQHEAAVAAMSAELATFDAQRATREAAMMAQREEAAALEPAIDAFDQRFEMMRELVARGATSQRDLFTLATQRSEAKSRQAAVIGQSAAAAREIIEIERRRASAVAARRAEWSGDLTEAVASEGEVAEQLRRRRDRLERMVIRATISGAVQQMAASEQGAVLPAGAMVAEIIPIDRPLVAQVRVSPDEIGFVDVGDLAELQVITYGLSAFGQIDGEVTDISPTAFTGEDGRSYFEVELALRSRFEDKADLKALSPGMSLTANLLGDRSSVLGYLMEPFSRASSLAFTSP
ncbi:MAG: HlyD family type I secretion periplasmic adaptor subunit [Pseudomonadota bacterium]